MMAEDSESAASQQSLELDDQDTCGIDGDNEEENEHMQGSPGGDLGAKKKKKKQKRKKEKPSSGGTKSDSASDSQEIKVQLLLKVRGDHGRQINISDNDKLFHTCMCFFISLLFSLKQNPAIPVQKLQDIQRAMELLSACHGPAKNIDEATKHKYQFWDTQPVPKLNEVVTSHGPIEPDKENIRQEPYSLPQGFMWDTLDLSNAEVLKELYTLLNENYVEDDDNMFRFDYSSNFLKWALRPPGWLPHWHCGVRVSSNKKLVGFISAIPASIRIYDTVKKMVEINFLCVHKKLRSKRVAPVLIREITRRVNLEGIFQAVYTAGVVLPKPVSTCSVWGKKINVKMFATKTAGLRTMEKKDVKQVQELLEKYLKQFHLGPVMDEEEVTHWFLPQENIIDTYVVEKDFDVFNALDLMENKTFLEKLKFGIGDGNLQYYLYNWKCPAMDPEKVRFMLTALPRAIAQFLLIKYSLCWLFWIKCCPINFQGTLLKGCRSP
ncbi:Glycylpeptide N-tetradecanoyltransferase 2 [Acipenser ruthenus]|uniref:Glycylpeptide N-tetradecanoyltransferase n=1 Tax=Acipenser ruthenus TaxID=7906 RepID=A0A444U1Y8_ACIRT|nr:Glycylpeptide N-tetradecanoyltransferase 2 [Acipenser ruthenus]